MFRFSILTTFYTGSQTFFKGFLIGKNCFVEFNLPGTWNSVTLALDGVTAVVVSATK